MSWDAAHVVTFFDALGERGWTRFEDGRTPAPSFDTHVRMLERYVSAGDRVLDAGSGSGRFALELLRLGAHVTALDLSPVRRDGVGPTLEIFRTGILPDREGYGHLPMKLFRWSDVEALLAPYGDVVDGAPAGVMPHLAVDEPELKELLAAFDEAVADDPGSRSCGEHIIGILQVA